jgi:hypothetical protein
MDWMRPAMITEHLGLRLGAAGRPGMRIPLVAIVIGPGEHLTLPLSRNCHQK